jgi:hypothetical protein
LIQLSRFSGSCIGVDYIAETVPNANGRLHQDLRIVPILRWADQFPTRDSECSVSRVRYPVEEGMMEILLVVWFGRFRGLAGE